MTAATQSFLMEVRASDPGWMLERECEMHHDHRRPKPHPEADNEGGPPDEKGQGNSETEEQDAGLPTGGGVGGSH